VENRNEEWWECTNLACGQTIQFVMIVEGYAKANPTCFCGSGMKRTYVKPNIARYDARLAFHVGSDGRGDLRTKGANPEWISLSLQPMN
jgi:hypothetical protein